MATKTAFPKATENMFEATRFDSARDKMLAVNATVNFLKSDMDPKKFTTRAYNFFHQTLSMSACYDRDGFIYQHLRTDDSKDKFLNEVRGRISSYAGLDPARGSDMAGLFDPNYDGRYAQLVGYGEDDLY